MKGKIGQGMSNHMTVRHAFSPLVRNIAAKAALSELRIKVEPKRRPARRSFSDDLIAKLRWVLEDGIYSRPRIAEFLGVPVHTIAGIANGVNYRVVQPIKEPDWQFVADLRAGKFHVKAQQ